MNGVIRTREKCAHCGQKFVEGYIGREPDLVCSCGRTPRSYYIYIYWRGDWKVRDRKGKKFKSYDSAYRLLTEIRNKIEAHTFDIRDYISQTFNGRKLIIKWYRSKCRAGLAPTTLDALKGHIRNYFSPIAQKVLPELDCAEIRTGNIDDFFEKLPPHISLKTKDNIMTNLKSFVNWLIRKEILQRDPEFPVISVPEPAKRWSKKENLLVALPFVPDHDRPVIHFMLYHPLRSGEVSALKVKDFMMDYRIIHIRQAFSKKMLRTRKNKKPYYCPISEYFDTAILKNKFPDQFVFLNSIGNPYSSNHLKKIWSKACEKSGIEYIPLKNAGRTSIASDAANRGESYQAIAAALGNTPQVVESNYAHLNVDAARRVIDGPWKKDDK